MDIFVPKNIYESDIRGETLVAYILIKAKFISMPFDEIFISPQDIAFYVEDLSSPSINRAGESLEELYDNQLFDMEKVGKFKYIVRGYDEDDYFAVIKLEHILKIFEKSEEGRYKRNKSCYDIAKYYIHLMGLRLNKTRVCNLSLEELAKKTFYNVGCIQRYNDYLEKHKVLYIFRNYFCKNQSRTNLYGMYEDKEYVVKFAREHEYREKNTANSDWRRSVSRKYNYFLKNPNRYDEVEKWALRREVERYNEEMDELQKLYPGNEYIKRKKDISVLS